MLQGYWRLFFAVGLTFFLAGASLGQPVGENADTQPGASEDADHPSAQLDAGVSATLKDALDRIASALEAANNPPDAAQEDRRAGDDLQAQQDMAKWAFLMFIANAVGVLIGGVSLFLIWQTVSYTRQGSIAARDAVIEAERATMAARDAVAETRRIGEAQAKAYIQFEPTKVILAKLNNAKKFGNEIGVILLGDVWNTGQTPVIQHGQRFRIQQCNVKVPLPIPKRVTLKEFSHSSGEIGRDKSRTTRLQDSIPIDRGALVSGDDAIRVTGCFTYVDVFGGSAECWFDGLVMNAGAFIEYHDNPFANVASQDAPALEWHWIRADQYETQ